jgi:hypothetical protein
MCLLLIYYYYRIGGEMMIPVGSQFGAQNLKVNIYTSPQLLNVIIPNII